MSFLFFSVFFFFFFLSNSSPITFKREKNSPLNLSVLLRRQKILQNWRGREGGREIPVKNLDQGQKPDRKALFEGNAQGEEEGTGK